MIRHGRKLIAAAFLLSLFWLKCGSREKKTAQEQLPDGKLIYRQNCVACHGADGTMGANGASNLSLSALKEEETAAVISNGRKAMIPFKEVLSKEEIHAVTKYVMTLRGDVPS